MVDRELAWKKHPRLWKSSFRTWKAPCALKSFWIHIPVTMKKINNLERQSCSKFPATFEKPVALGKTALYHATFTHHYATFGFRIPCAQYIYAQEVRKMFTGRQNTVFHVFSHFFTPFSHFVRAFFTLVCRKETKHVKTVTDFSNVELRHFS